MNNFTLQVWYDASQCSFYTVVKEGDQLSETDKFFERFEDDENPYATYAYELLELITNAIGEKHGATDDFFNRTEDRAQALPPKPTRRIREIEVIGIHFPLRLFCYRICPTIVVLFNGGVKDAPTALDSEDLVSKFRDAQAFTKRIEQAIRNEIIDVAPKQKRLFDFQTSDEINL